MTPTEMLKWGSRKQPESPLKTLVLDRGCQLVNFHKGIASFVF